MKRSYILRCKCGKNTVYYLQETQQFWAVCSGCTKVFLCQPVVGVEKKHEQDGSKETKAS